MNKRWTLGASSALVLLICNAAAQAQLSYPMVTSLKPAAVQIGTSQEIEVEAIHNLYGAYQVMVSGEGISGEVVTKFDPPDAEKGKPMVTTVKVNFTAAADASPGVRDVRLATQQGVSTLGQLVVVQEPVVLETKDLNDVRDKAQAVAAPATWCGTIDKPEDVDFYSFNAEAGQSLTFHVYSQRLQDRIHDLQTHSDPIITLRNAQGTTIAQVDNHFFADPLLNFKFEVAGQYSLEIRDVRYQGNKSWCYTIEASGRPFVTSVYPPRVTPGAQASLAPIGYGVPPEPVTMDMPMELPEGTATPRLPLPSPATNAPLVVVSKLPDVLEAATPNQDFTSGQNITLPAGISGRIEQADDKDVYLFQAKKGEAFCFEVRARRQWSELDGVLRIINDQGNALVENDDGRILRITSADPWIERWEAPADGKFGLEIRDLHARGGPGFVYFIAATRAEPTFELQLDSDKTLLSPGLGGVIFVRAVRKHGFAGDILLSVEGLPAGVTATSGRILASGSDGCIVLEAAADAPRQVSNVRVVGRGQHPQAEGQPPRDIVVAAEPLQEIYSPGGGRTHFPSSMHTVSVSDALDLTSVTLSVQELTLKPGESQAIDVKIERAPNFKGNVTLDMLYRHLNQMFADTLPKGVTIDEKESQTLLTGGKNEGKLVLKAAADAPAVEKQQVAVMAQVSINFVMKMSYTAKPVLITVLPKEEAKP